MNELTVQDLSLVVSRLPKDVVKMIKERGLILGGGFIRATIAGEKPSDIDLFGKSKEQLEAAARALADDRFRAKFHETKNAFSVFSGVRMPVQFIFRWLFDTPDACMSSFDFTVAQAAVWFEDEHWHSVCHAQFYSDLAARRLTYTSPIRNEDAGGSLLRVRKFLARGYNIQAQSLAAVTARLFMAVEWGKIQTEEDASLILCGLLREVDPLTVVDGIDIVDEHETKGGA
ncbi:MAG TPA: hypothetical protein DCZ63_09000 [Geobacter sp.]|nr:hypothetical protein [Geobacter sp.]